MQPIVQNITFVRGDTLQFDVHLTDVEATVESMFFSAKKSATDDVYALSNSGSCQTMAPFFVERKC